MQIHTIVRTVEAGGTFDGVTQEILGGYAPAPTASARTYKANAVTTGRFGIGALGVKGISPRLVSVRVYGAIQPGDKWQLRSARPADSGNGSNTIPDTLVPSDVVLQELPLSNTFGRFALSGTTDAVAIFHDLIGGSIHADTAEIMVIDGTELELNALVQILNPPGVDCCCVQALDVTIPDTPEEEFYQLPSSQCALLVVAESEVNGGQLRLPAEPKDGDSVWVTRRGRFWFRVVADVQVNGVDAPFGVVMDSDEESVLFRYSEAAGWFGNKPVPQVQPELVTDSIPVFPGPQAVRVIHLDVSGDTTLPSVLGIAPGQLLWVTNNGADSGNPTQAIVRPFPGELIDGRPDLAIPLANKQDTLLLLRDGDLQTPGWRSVNNLFGRYDQTERITVAPFTKIYTAGWRGRRVLILDGDGTVTLPPGLSTPIGCQLLAISLGAGIPALVPISADGQIVGLGNAPAASINVLSKFWVLLEYQGNGLWSASA